MIRTRELFILVSQTNTGIAKLIRGVSGYPYNHVSVTLDPRLSRWYSFARYVQDAPLYGGLVSESVQRLCGPEGDIQVRAYRVEIPEQKALELERLLPLADKPASGLIYNHFDAVANALGFQLPLPRCHTCLSFACEILDQQHVSIESLCTALAPQLFYEGSLRQLVSVSDSCEDPYFVPMGMISGSVKSIAHLGLLSGRTMSHGALMYLRSHFRRTVH